jgi:hypothetical protein
METWKYQSRYPNSILDLKQSRATLPATGCLRLLTYIEGPGRDIMGE